MIWGSLLIVSLAIAWLYIWASKDPVTTLKTGTTLKKLLLYVLVFLPIGILAFITGLFLLNPQLSGNMLPSLMIINLLILAGSIRITRRTRKHYEWHTVILLADVSVLAIYIALIWVAIMFGQG